MNKSGNLNIRVNPDTKTEAEKIYSGFGITLSDAVNMFLSKSVMVGGLPFDLVQPKYNADTEAAMREARELVQSGKAKRYASADDMLRDLNA